MMNTTPIGSPVNDHFGHGKVQIRRGAAAILVLAMLGVFVIVAAVTIDYAYMQLIRADLRVATDAAAKAGAEALARTESESAAKAAAIEYAGYNKVAGSNLSISQSDISFGHVTAGSGGKWTFQQGVQPYNSVQVNSQVNASLFFGKVLERNFFEPEYVTVAGYQEFDVCLCLDRSGSMLFDMSGTEYVYPPNNPNLSSFKDWGTIWRYHLSPPHPTDSRWAVLARAVDDFYDVIEDSSPTPYSSLVTWSSDYDMPINPHTEYKDATLNVGLPTSSDCHGQESVVTSAISNLGKKPMMGGTNMSAGIDKAVQHLTSNKARTLSSKVIVLMTDGEWNDGRDPMLAAQAAKNQGITIHTISMLTNQQTILGQISALTGGRSFTTANENELRAAFKEIAQGLKVVLVN